MSQKLRVLPLLLLMLLALGFPALAQDAESQSTSSTDADGWMTYSATDCEYGGEISSIAATDATTVTFNLCYPDPRQPPELAAGIFATGYLRRSVANGCVKHCVRLGPAGFTW